MSYVHLNIQKQDGPLVKAISDLSASDHSTSFTQLAGPGEYDCLPSFEFQRSRCFDEDVDQVWYLYAQLIPP